MLIVVALICILSACISSILVNDSHFMFWSAFGDFFFFTVEWIAKFFCTSVVIVVLIVAVYYSYQCFQCLQNKVTPVIYCSDHDFYKKVEKAAPILTQCYMPTFVWGYCGHIQTIIFALWGRFNCPFIKGERVILKLDDGATLSYDIFHSRAEKPKDELMFFVAPGFANNSETDYIRTFMQYVTSLGYRCAVLNHIGTIPEIPVTSSRVFSFGNTHDLHAALTDFISKYPKSKVILFGYSLGGNLVPKYLGEDRERSPNILAGFSICSLLDANRAVNGSERWPLLRYFYQYFLARTAKQIINRHRYILLSDEIIARYDLDVNAIFSAKSLVTFDELYTRRIYNFSTLDDYYNWSSAVNYLNGIKVPMVFINALDDPLLSDILHYPVREFAGCRKKVIAIELRYGGHLGFFENNYFISESITWLEKALIQLAEAIHNDSKESNK
ncbi:hypothetical protein V9T40_013630 [Parthenolecanium corni]|uniref:AB hydrolase-1 domain-containing protein n=1 Tax=Parthenolecanium corni TaxID=536013 RepID=A0AAN9TPE0_9HEMI